MNAKKINEHWAQLNQGDYRGVINSLKAKESLQESALVLRGQAYFLVKDYREAVLDFSKALQANPENIVARCWRGLAHAHKKNWEQAYADLSPEPFFFHREYLFELHHTFWPLRFQDESLRRPLNVDFTAAKDPHDSAFQTVGTNQRARKKLAVKYRALAKKYYFEDRSNPLYNIACKRAADLDPQDELSPMLQMLALIAEGKYAEAEAALGLGVQQQLEQYNNTGKKDDLPSREELANWGVILHELQDFEGSLAVFSEIVPGGPDDSFAHYYSAMNWLMLNETEKSRACFNMMIERYMFDSWEVMIVPFRKQVLQWLQETAKSA